MRARTRSALRRDLEKRRKPHLLVRRLLDDLSPSKHEEVVGLGEESDRVGAENSSLVLEKTVGTEHLGEEIYRKKEEGELVGSSERDPKLDDDSRAAT